MPIKQKLGVSKTLKDTTLHLNEQKKKEKPYILVARDEFILNCDGYTLFLALKVLFLEVRKTNTGLHNLLCKKLIDCGAFKA